MGRYASGTDGAISKITYIVNMNDDFIYPPWAMLAWNYYDLTLSQLPETVMIQPKLNGVRARWHHIEKKFISRDGKVFPPYVLPHLYAKYNDLSYSSLDGELYCHEMPFQTIAGMVTPNRNAAHKDIEKISYMPFDIIDFNLIAYDRQILLRFFTSNLPIIIIKSSNIDESLQVALKQGYEGIMLRNPNGLYIPGRSRNLIKVKPLLQTKVRIIKFIEGTGKFFGMLGAIVVCLEPAFNDDTNPREAIYFKIGGGRISTEDRRYIWYNKTKLIHQLITIQYSETSIDGKPLKSQIANAKEFYSIK